MPREEIERDGDGATRLPFVLDAAVRLAAATESCGGEDGSFGVEHAGRASWAFYAADALWVEACKWFPEDVTPTEPADKCPNCKADGVCNDHMPF